MKCYNLAIVEDEPHTARYIRKIVEDMGIYKVAACCESAEEMLCDDCVTELDILLTDIKMTGLNGIELVEKILKKVPRLMVVIISGYSSFDFARAAISLKVSHYLLKPIDRKELVTVLLELYEKLADIQEENGKNYIHEVYEQSRRILEKNEEPPYPYLQALLVTGSDDRKKLILRCKTAFSLDRLEDCRVLCYRTGFVILVGMEKKKESEKLQEMAESICIWEKASGNSAVLVYTKNAFEVKKLRQQLLDMHRFQEKNYVIGTAAVKEYLKTSADKTDYEEERLLLENLRQSLYVKNTGIFTSLLEKLFYLWKKRKASLYVMKLALYNITMQFLAITESKEELVTIMGNISAALYGAKSYETAKENIQELLLPAVTSLLAAGTGSQKQSRKMYQQIIEFLSANIRQNFSLQEISTIFCISQPYVSKLFRIYSGMSYKDYVTNLKIDMAKEIMREQRDVMIKDVADMVGYDQLYFSTVFHRITGKYPKHYRENLTE